MTTETVVKILTALGLPPDEVRDDVLMYGVKDCNIAKIAGRIETPVSQDAGYQAWYVAQCVSDLKQGEFYLHTLEHAPGPQAAWLSAMAVALEGK